ncbi:hypothetical protein OV079_29070 [Nannocystis pusilla]|uniref:Uncharacterized protein n=1 Tax=Nannocystis pusilla TaxID=889268 RepID=A0A9X3ETM6_9BACT|nr:hypothetical protein [Nannocystis pusilla]MCY1009545.1 hypothetical protein [Nannocystis pusilla]
MLRRAASLVLAPALACGPSLAQLERGHHYDEAICGAAERAFPKGQVAEVIRRALDPAVHVAAVPREQLAAALGDDAPELERFVLLRITHDSNTIPLDRYSADFTLRSDRPFVRAQPDGDPNGAAVSAVRVWDDGKVVSLQPTDLLRLATVFAERLPGPHTVQPDAIDKAIHAVGTIGAAVATIATLGLFGGLLRGRGAGPQPRTEYPTVAEIRRAAPRATRLFDAVAHLQPPVEASPARAARPWPSSPARPTSPPSSSSSSTSATAPASAAGARSPTSTRSCRSPCRPARPSRRASPPRSATTCTASPSRRRPRPRRKPSRRRPIGLPLRTYHVSRRSRATDRRPSA